MASFDQQKFALTGQFSGKGQYGERVEVKTTDWKRKNVPVSELHFPVFPVLQDVDVLHLLTSKLRKPRSESEKCPPLERTR